MLEHIVIHYYQSLTSKFHMKSWTIRFDFSVSCYSDGIKAPSLLSFRTSSVAVALAFYWIVDKFHVLCYCCCVCVVFCCCVVDRLVVVFSLHCFADLVLGFGAMTHVIFATLVLRFEALLCNFFGCQ